MGYDDEAGSSQRHRSRARQPVKRPGAREPEYRKNREPRYEEPRYRESRSRESQGREARNKEPRHETPGYQVQELNLITDTFKRDDDYSRQKHINRPPDRKEKNRGREKAGKQSAAAKQGGAAYHTPAQKKAQKRKRKILIILLEFIILVSVVVFAAYSYLSNGMRSMERLPWNPGEIKNPEISQEKQEQMKGYWTIAVFGVDSRNDSVGKGNNSDVNIICNINQDTGEIKLVSVFRDTYLNINDKNSYNKINSAYLQGGPDQTVKALNKNMDLDIDDYVTFNWKAVADAINILDGIDVELTKSEFYYINAFVTETVKATGVPSTPVEHAGLVHLDGVQAVAYGRLRLMDTDYARTERQRKIISLAFDKAKKADWATLNNIIQTVFPQVSSSVGLPDILMMGRDIGKLHLGESTGFPADRSDANMGSKGACVIPQTLESNVKDIHRFLFGDEDYVTTDMVRTISKKIISDTGLAKKEKPAATESASEPKATTESGTDRTKDPSGASHRESDNSREYGTYHESGSSNSTADGRPGGGASGWEKWETDEDGNLIDPALKESGGGAVKPGTGQTKPGTGTTKPSTETTKPGMTTPTTGRETIPARPGDQGGGNNPNAPGSNTDTGVILGPGGINSPDSGNNNSNQNMPGGSNNNSNPNAPGSGSSNNNPNMPGSGNNNNGQMPGSGNGNNNQAPGSGNGTVEFSGPMGP